MKKQIRNISGFPELANPTDSVRVAIEKYSRSDMIVFDIGANIGAMTGVFSSLTKTVVAFEPVPECVQRIKSRNLANVTVVQSAVSDVVGDATFYMDQRPDLNKVGSSLRQIEDIRDVTKAITVSVTTIDDFVSRSNLKPDFIKIDVEGCKELVIKGGIKTILEHRPYMIFEVWGYNWPRFEPIISGLEKIYRFERASNGNDALLDYRSGLITETDDVICIPK